MRILVTLVQPSTDGAAVARQAERSAGVPVRHLAAISPSLHALGLSCSDAACSEALRSLRADSLRFAEVVVDERKTRH